MLPFYKKSQPAAFLVLFPLLFSIHVFAQSGNSTTVEDANNPLGCRGAQRNG